jgi:hypothetical protein
MVNTAIVVFHLATAEGREQAQGIAYGPPDMLQLPEDPAANTAADARTAIEQVRNLVAGIDEAGYRILSETEQAAVNVIRRELGPAGESAQAPSDAERGEQWVESAATDVSPRKQTRAKLRGA